MALAVAAPASASASHTSTCVTGLLDWDSFKDGSTQTGLNLTPGGNTGVTLRVTTSGDTAKTNGQVTKTTTGGKSSVLRFYDVNNKKNTSQTVTITFSKTVRNVQFSLLDVDSSTGEYEDLVQIVSPTTYTGAVHSNVTGAGTKAKPYRAKTTNSPVAGSSANSNVDLAFVGPLTSISFIYGQDGTVGGDPFIGISDISFQYCS
ncbi:MAG TPA: hypothetical protein VH085_14195 [Nocardioides sp.]|nr:hypothetical protein [Nocardioides sp.]